MFYEVLMEKRAEREAKRLDSSLEQQRHKNIRAGRVLHPSLIVRGKIADGVANPKGY